jgi:long-chain fatty acid transport protein
MKRIRPIDLLAILLAAAVLIALPAQTAWASGLWLYERATPEVGTANAGVAARAQDASIAASNPAGMTRIEKPEIMAGIQPILMNVRFRPNSGTTTTGPSGDADGVLPSGSFFYVHPLSKDWRFGFSVGSGFGLGVKYEDNWVGRYYLQESALITMSVMPSLAYRVNDWLSVGGGLNLQYAHLKNRVAINNLGPSDGQMEFKDDSFGVGGGVGILVEPRKGTRVGLTYMSPISQEFKDTPAFTNLGAANAGLQAKIGEIDLKMTVPQQVMFSVYHEVTPDWAVMGNVGWQNWTKFGYTGLSVSSNAGATVSTVANAQYDDTFHVAVGTHYRFHPQWRVTAGFAYDSSPAGETDRTVAMPLDRGLRYSGGLIWDLSERVTLGLAYTFLDGGKATLTQSRPGNLSSTVSGEFSSNYYHMIALHFAMRF